MKRCSKCGEVKPLDAFSRNAATRDGYGGWCKGCLKAYRAANPEMLAAQQAAYRAAHPEKMAAYRAANAEKLAAQQAAWRAANVEKRAAALDAWRAANADKVAAYYVSNRDRYAARCALRRARLLQATPAWANLELVAAYYTLAAAFTQGSGVEHHVDHIEPLQGKHVCGLHCEFNLQVLPAQVNAAKGNRPSAVRGVR